MRMDLLEQINDQIVALGIAIDLLYEQKSKLEDEYWDEQYRQHKELEEEMSMKDDQYDCPYRY